jgi:hypothetical protein
VSKAREVILGTCSVLAVDIDCLVDAAGGLRNMRALEVARNCAAVNKKTLSICTPLHYLFVEIE